MKPNFFPAVRPEAAEGAVAASLACSSSDWKIFAKMFPAGPQQDATILCAFINKVAMVLPFYLRSVVKSMRGRHALAPANCDDVWSSRRHQNATREMNNRSIHFSQSLRERSQLSHPETYQHDSHFLNDDLVLSLLLLLCCLFVMLAHGSQHPVQRSRRQSRCESNALKLQSKLRRTTLELVQKNGELA